MTAAALAGLMVTAGCAAPEGLSTPVDLTRAEAAWADPWFAPATTSVATTAYGSDGQLRRTVGERAWTLSATPQRALAWEVWGATTHGWSLVAVRCDGDQPFAQLTRGNDPGDGILATVEAEPVDGASTRVTVRGEAAHHADGSWPQWPVLYPDDTCLGGGPEEGNDRLTLPAHPLAGDHSQPDVEGYEGWERDEPTDGERALVEAVEDDQFLHSLSARLSGGGGLRTGDNRRTGAVAEGVIPRHGLDPVTTVVEIISSAMTSWELTSMACTPGRDPSIDARLLLRTEHGPATARLLVESGSDEVAWTVTVAPPESPALESLASVPELTSPRCLTGGRTMGAVTVEGVPVAVPAALQPVAPGT